MPPLPIKIQISPTLLFSIAAFASPRTRKFIHSGSSMALNSSSSSLQQVQEFYNEKSAQEYGAMMPDELKKIQPDLDALLSHLQDSTTSQQQGVVLDICCGTGDMLAWIARHCPSSLAANKKKYVFRGSDLSSDMLELARRQDTKDVAVTFAQGNMEDLTAIDDSSCALIMCNFAIHHLASCRLVLSECHRVLQKGTGLLYFSFWEGQGEMEGLPVKAWYHSSSTVKDILAEVGLECIRDREEMYTEFEMNMSFIFARKP